MCVFGLSPPKRAVLSRQFAFFVHRKARRNCGCIVRRRRVRRSGISRVESENSVLAGPLGRHVAEPGDADAAREVSVERRLKEGGREERERDRHVDLARAAAFSLSDRLGTCLRIDGELIKPAMPPGDGLDEGVASLGADGTRIDRGVGGGEQDLAAALCGPLLPRCSFRGTRATPNALLSLSSSPPRIWMNPKEPVLRPPEHREGAKLRISRHPRIDRVGSAPASLGLLAPPTQIWNHR